MKIGFIGTGNMGGAIIKGYLASGAGVGNRITAFDLDSDKLSDLVRKTGIGIAVDVESLVFSSDIIVLAVKPQNYEDVLPIVAQVIKKRQIVVSMAAGISIAYIEKFLGNSCKIIRIMPNTPAMVGESMTAICKNNNVSEKEFDSVVEIFWSIGKTAAVGESLMDTVTGVSGSSPAYVYMFIDALAKCAVRNGMLEDDARVFAAQAVLGAAKMVLDTGIDPLTLRQNVCSPGGTTIEAVEALQKNGFEDSVIEGMQAAIDKSRKMTK
ncbi:pyrroline-5-carboxylate reductase [Clostridia bacterium]|nr:pyrroline-5-carboxylate reductase [Clostridia bacterium]